MTNSERNVMYRGLATGLILGPTLGLLLALVIATKPGLFN